MSDVKHVYRPFATRDGSMACADCHATLDDPIHGIVPRKFFEQMSPEERNAAKEQVANAVDQHCPGCYFLVVLFTPTLTTCVSNTPEEKLPRLLRETADSMDERKDWRIGQNCKPKIRTHPLFSCAHNCVVIGTRESSLHKDGLLLIAVDDGRQLLEPADDWKTA